MAKTTVHFQVDDPQAAESIHEALTAFGFDAIRVFDHYDDVRREWVVEHATRKFDLDHRSRLVLELLLRAVDDYATEGREAAINARLVEAVGGPADPHAITEAARYAVALALDSMVEQLHDERSHRPEPWVKIADRLIFVRDVFRDAMPFAADIADRVKSRVGVLTIPEVIETVGQLAPVRRGDRYATIAGLGEYTEREVIDAHKQAVEVADRRGRA